MSHGMYSGRGALDHAKEIVEKCATRATVFNDQGIVGTDLLKKPSSPVKEAGMECLVLDGLPAKPDCSQAQAAIDRFKAEKSDFIVAVGGGSVMDIAKLTSVFVIDAYTVRDLLDNPGFTDKCVPTLMAPATADTGPKTAPNSIVAVSEEELRVGIANDVMIADYVILDGEMVRHLPGKIAAATGVDALTHKIECHTSNKTDPFSGTFTLEALGLVFNRIEGACDDPDALDTKNAMLITAFYTGAVITASGTTVIHVLSYPLGGKYHTLYGVSNAILLIPVMKFNGPACREHLTAIYDRMAKDGRESGLPSEGRSARIIRRLDEIVEHLEISNSLKEYGIGDEDLDVLVEAGVDAKWLLVDNMREMTAEDARKLYLKIVR